MSSVSSFCDKLWYRAKLAVAWRWRQLWERLERVLVPMGLETLIAVRWPWPFKKPWQRRSITLGAPKGVGDELLATAVFREIKRRNPNCYLRFVSSHPSLMKGSPYIDEMIPYGEAYGNFDVHWLTYRQTIPPMYPVTVMMAASIGLLMERAGAIAPLNLEPDPVWDSRLAAIPEPRIVIQTCASKWTPYKNWFPEHWDALVHQLLQLGCVIEIGTESALPSSKDYGPNFYSFIGETDLPNYARTVREASVFVGPVSSGMHLAAAFQIPSVIIFGGYENPAGHHLPDAICLTGEMPCSPCWRQEGCEYDRECLRKIPVEMVVAAAEKQLGQWRKNRFRQT